MEWIPEWRAYIEWLVSLALMLGVGYLAHRLSQKDRARQLRERDAYLRQTLTHHGITQVQTLKDRSIHGSNTTDGQTPYQVHLILHSPPNRWFVYIHIEGSAPVLSPLTEHRARLAVNA